MKTFYLKVYADSEEEAKEVLKKDPQLTELKDDEVLQVLDDSLESCCETAQEELKDRVKDYLLENLQCQDDDEVYQELCDDFQEITDSNTPIYYSEIDAIYYLHGDDLDEAYQSEGIGDGGEENYRQVAIYYYIHQSLHEYWNDELKELVNEFCEYRDDISEANEQELKDYIEKSFS